jgi:hypothetical protein
MNLLRSICCLVGGRCVVEEPPKETMRGETGSEGDLGQKEAALETTGKEQMSHMGGDASKTAQRKPTKRGAKSGRRRSP